jgi:hypothetical protein
MDAGRVFVLHTSAGAALIYPTMLALMTNQAAPQEQGQAAGVSTVLSGLMSVFGPHRPAAQAIPGRAEDRSMDIQALFGLSVLMSFVAFGLVTKLYLWPRLRILEREDALTLLVVLHTFRFIGLSFLVPGVVSPSLPSAFAAPAAYGDLVAAMLAVAATIALSRHASLATLLVWLFNIWGTADLLFAFYQGQFGIQLDARMLGAAFFIPTAVVPPLLILHGLIFWLLVRPRR